MKNIFENPDEAIRINEMIAQFDYVSALSIICMGIDTIASVHEESAAEIADYINSAVKDVNNELGAFRFVG